MREPLRPVDPRLGAAGFELVLHYKREGGTRQSPLGVIREAIFRHFRGLDGARPETAKPVLRRPPLNERVFP